MKYVKNKEALTGLKDHCKYIQAAYKSDFRFGSNCGATEHTGCLEALMKKLNKQDGGKKIEKQEHFYILPPQKVSTEMNTCAQEFQADAFANCQLITQSMFDIQQASIEDLQKQLAEANEIIQKMNESFGEKLLKVGQVGGD